MCTELQLFLGAKRLTFGPILCEAKISRPQSRNMLIYNQRLQHGTKIQQEKSFIFNHAGLVFGFDVGEGWDK